MLRSYSLQIYALITIYCVVIIQVDYVYVFCIQLINKILFSWCKMFFARLDVGIAQLILVDKFIDCYKADS